MAKRPVMSFSLGNHRVGAGRAFLIAEVAQAHDGSLGFAHAFIGAAARAGVDAVKFQTHIAAAESTFDEQFRVKFSDQDATRYDYWKRMEFTEEQWRHLARHASDEGLVFLSSAFSVAAVQLLARVGMPAWKIASGERESGALLDAMVSAGGPFIASTGMSTWREIDALVSRLRNANREVAILQCTSEYPTPLEHVGLNVLDEMRRRYGVPVGLSDHTGQTAPIVAAIARGADVIEAHITLDRHMFGPDVAASLNVQEFRAIVDFRNALAVIDGHPVDKDGMAEKLSAMRDLFGRSLSPVRALAAGTIINEDMLDAKKPSTGIPERQLARVVGRRLVRDVSPERLLSWSDIESDHDKA